MFNPFARHAWDAPPEPKQPREGTMSIDAPDAILDRTSGGASESVVDAPKTGNKIFAFILLAMAVAVAVGILMANLAEPYVGPQERASIAAEKVCHFPEEAIEGGILSARPVPTQIAFVDVHETLRDDAGFYIPYVSATGHHVAHVNVDRSTAEAEVHSIPEVQSCG